jgi:stage II sporulation protein D
MHNQQIDWEQPERKKEVKLGGKTFTTRKIRTDFGLSSSFFSIKTNYKEVIFQGRGYGHGVGVCQQGATRMADAGWDFQRIIAFYYDGLRIGKVK